MGDTDTLLGHITVAGERLALMRTHYIDGRTAVIALTEDGQRYGTLSVNPGEAIELPPGCIAIKTWGENGPLFAAASMSGLFELTGQQIRLGYVVAPIWRLP